MTLDPCTPAALLGAMREPCPARDTGICACADCEPMRAEIRLRRLAAEVLSVATGEVCALVYRGTLHGVAGWRASVATREGERYWRAWATTLAGAVEAALAMARGTG